jgi:CBS domain-containing protein
MRGVAGSGPVDKDSATMKLLRDVAIRHLLTVDPQNTLRRAAKVMTDRAVGAAVVIANEKVVGIVTERDVLRAIADDRDVDDTKVDDVMTRDVVSGAPGWDILKAVEAMEDGGFRHLLVMEMDDPVGIVSLRDLMTSMAEMIQPDDSESD